MAKLITLGNLSRFKKNCDDSYVSKQSYDAASVDFAQSERLKSKNLLGLKSGSYTQNGVTLTVLGDGETIVINGTATENIDLYIYYSQEFTFSGQYAFSITTISGSRTLSGWETFYLKAWDYQFELSNNNYVRTFSSFSTTEGRFSYKSGTVFDNWTIKIQLEANNRPTSYQPYNGAIVREKQFNNEIRSRELLYSYEDFIGINGSTLTTLAEFYDLFSTNTNAIYVVHLGKLQSNTFKDLVGTPSGFGNYVDCRIKQVATHNDVKRYGVFELFATDNWYQKVAKGYIYKNGYDEIVFTGWSIIGG